MWCETKRRIKKRIMPTHMFVSVLAFAKKLEDRAAADWDGKDYGGSRLGEFGLEFQCWTWNMLEELFFQSVFWRLLGTWDSSEKVTFLFLEIYFSSSLKIYKGFLSPTVNKHIIFTSPFSNALEDKYDRGFLFVLRFPNYCKYPKKYNSVEQKMW